MSMNKNTNRDYYEGDEGDEQPKERHQLNEIELIEMIEERLDHLSPAEFAKKELNSLIDECNRRFKTEYTRV